MLHRVCVLNPTKQFILGIFLAWSCFAQAGEPPRLSSTSTLSDPLPFLDFPTQSASVENSQTFFESLKNTLGITYFSFFFGPGLHPDKTNISPNQMGYSDNDGIFFQNQMSVRYKFSGNLALDFQTRFKLFINNAQNNDNFTLLRWEAPRIGISGKLMSGKDWTLIGAVNTDFPYFMPAPFTGYQAQQRSVLFSPGMFASLKYEPSTSRWSLFSVVQPRYFFYVDREAAEPQFSKGGYTPGNKPELIIAFQPTLNYRIGEKTKITLGSTIEYRKHVLSSWNIFHASLITNGDSPAWRLNAVPLFIGVTFNIAPYLSIFPYLNSFPIAAQRIDARNGSQASFLEAASVGMWINGTIF